MDNRIRWENLIIAVVLGFGFVVLAITFTPTVSVPSQSVAPVIMPDQPIVPAEEPVARTANVPCYFEQPVQGSQKFVAGSGCEIEVQSGATFDLQSGATTDFSGGVDLDGAALIIDADGDSSLQASVDDGITITLGVAGGSVGVATGNLRVGNGSNDTTLNGEDMYVEGTLEVDGATNFDGNADFAGTINADGAVTLNSSLDVDGNLTSGTGAITVADTLQVTGVADFDAGLTFGPTPLFPLGISVASQEIVCATTSTFTGSTSIDVTDLTTATYVLASQVTAPITTAAYLYVSDPTTTTITLSSLESTGFGAGTTGVVAHYCVVGVE